MKKRMAALTILLFCSILLASAQSGPAISTYIAAGQPGATVTITGTGFGAMQGSSFVSINGVTAAVSNWSDTSLTVAVPSNATSGPMSVTVGTLTSNKVSFYVTDPLSQALVNVGADPLVALTAAQLSEGVIANAKLSAALVGALATQQSADEQKEATDIATLTANIAAIPAGPVGPQGPQGIAGPAGPQGVQGVPGASAIPLIDPYSYAVTSTVVPALKPGVCSPAKIYSVNTAGQFADYTVTVPAAGTYKLVACIASGTTSTSPWQLHFEYPVGTNLGALTASTIPSPVNNWWVFRQVPSAPVSLPAGQITVRVVFDAVSFNFGGFSIQ